MKGGEMVIELTLIVDEDIDVDVDDDKGITEEAYLRLVTALNKAGFSIDTGPDRRTGDD
jgi:hypothetical protein